MASGTRSPPELIREIGALMTQSIDVFEEVQTDLIAHYEDFIK